MFIYLFIAILAGIVCKLYDDLQDNFILEKFKNITFIEYLKGIHYICITSLAIQEPLFFIFFYMGNFFNYLSNPFAFHQPYEHSVIYSFTFLFLLLDYNKINNLHIFVYFLIFILFLINYLEPLFEPFFYLTNNITVKNNNSSLNEFSYSKLYTRIFFLFASIIYCFLSKSYSTFYIYSYFIGYFSISVIIQSYSLYSTKNIINNNIDDNNVDDNNVDDNNVDDNNVDDNNVDDNNVDDNNVDDNNVEVIYTNDV